MTGLLTAGGAPDHRGLMEAPRGRPGPTAAGPLGAPSPTGLADDPELPALRAMALEGADAVLRRVGLAPPFDSFEVLKVHAGRRCTFAFRAAGRLLVAKAFRRSVDTQIELFDALQRHGLATGDGPTAPRLVARDAGLRLLVLERLDGPSGAPLIARGERVGELAAGWLVRQWGAAVTVGRTYSAEEFLQRVARDARVVIDASAACGEATASLLERLALVLPGPSEPELVHGSFSVNHVLDLGTGAGVIDWDGFCQGPRELDAAAFLATLARVAGGDEAALASPSAESAAAFRAGLAGELDPAALAWFEAGSLIHNARHLCALRRPGWEARSEILIARARTLLPVER